MQHGKGVVISYWSRQLTIAERNYSTIEREALAAVSIIKEFYPYLYGYTFKLITDHNPLTSLWALKDVGGCLSRWLMYLQQFEFYVEYRAGKHHTNADVLSWIPSADTVMSVSQSLLGNSSIDIRAAQHGDEQLSPIITALCINSSPPHNIALPLSSVS